MKVQAITLLLIATPAWAETLSPESICNMNDPAFKCSIDNTSNTITITGDMSLSRAERECEETLGAVVGMAKVGVRLDPASWYLNFQSPAGKRLARCYLP